MAASIYNVAERAGVSISTVSRILNGSANVSEKKRAAVQEAMEFYQYEPNQFARGLVKQESGMIGVYFPPGVTSGISSMFESSYSLELLKGVEEALINRNYSMVLISENTEYYHRSKKTPKYLEFVRQRKIDGLLLSGLNDKAMKDTVMQEIMDMDYPMVYIGKKFHEKGLNIYAQFGQYNVQMLDTLYKNGHRKVLFLIGEIHQHYLPGISAEVTAGMPELTVCPVVMEDLLPEREKMLWLIKKWVLEEGCTAVCSQAMELTQMILGICAQLGISVPEQLSIISVEHRSGEGQFLYPGISAFYVPAREMGNGAASLLIRAIRGEELEEMSLEYETKYMERDSIRRLS